MERRRARVFRFQRPHAPCRVSRCRFFLRRMFHLNTRLICIFIGSLETVVTSFFSSSPLLNRVLARSYLVFFLVYRVLLYFFIFTDRYGSVDGPWGARTWCTSWRSRRTSTGASSSSCDPSACDLRNNQSACGVSHRCPTSSPPSKKTKRKKKSKTKMDAQTAMPPVSSTFIGCGDDPLINDVTAIQ